MIEPDAPAGLSNYPSSPSWIKLAVLGVLVILFEFNEIVQLKNGWLSDASWSHGFILPFFSLYLLYDRREEIFSLKRKTAWLGLVVVIAAILIKAYVLLVVRNVWLAQLTIPLLIFGLVIFLCGWKLAYTTAVPVFYIALAMPWPDRLYRMVSIPLQELAAKIAAGILQLCGVQIEVTNSAIKVVSTSGTVYPLQVAEACSGMRSLMAFVALGVAMAYLWDRPLWQRLVVIFAGIPVAIACNLIRVISTCSMYVWDRPELGHGIMHSLMGVALLIPAMILFFGIIKLMDAMYEEVEEEEGEDSENKETAADENNENTEENGVNNPDPQSDEEDEEDEEDEDVS